MAKRYALRDDQWERIKNLLPGREETVGVTFCGLPQAASASMMNEVRMKSSRRI